MNKRLNKLVLVNWSLYSHLVMDFSDINFITGNTGSGKSTIADAIQLVLFGDTNGNYFNKAGDDESNRRLIDYLYADKGIENQRRKAPFLSFVIAEIERIDDSGAKSYFSLCYYADIEDDNSQVAPKTWFILDDRIPDEFLSSESVPLSSDSLRELWVRKYGDNYKDVVNLISRNKEYARRIRDARYLAIGEEYINALKKAVSFEKIKKMDTFIADFLCQSVNRPDFSQMKITYDELSSLAFDVEEKQKKRDLLDKIISGYDEIQRYLLTLRTAEYVSNKARLNLERNENISVALKLDKEKSKLFEIEEQQKVCKAEEDSLRDTASALEREIRDNENGRKKKELEEKINLLKAKIGFYQQKVESDLRGFEYVANKWCSIIEESADLDEEYQIDRVYLDNIYRLLSLNKSSGDIRILENGYESIAGAKNQAIRYKARAELKKNEYEQERKGCIKAIENLKSGIGNYPEEVIAFAEYLRCECSIESSFLADMLEIDSDVWRNAVEYALGSDRYSILVSPGDFKRAVAALREYPLKKDEVRILDLEPLFKNKPEVLPSSLATVVTSADQGAKLAVDNLLGHIMTTPDDNSFITSDCMLYRSSVLSKGAEITYSRPMIGKEQKEKAILSYQDALDEFERLIASLQRVIKFYSLCENVLVLEKTAISNYKDDLDSYDQIPVLEDEIEENIALISSLDLTYIEELERKRSEIITLLLPENDKQRLELGKEYWFIRQSLGQLEMDNNAIVSKINELERKLEEDPFKEDGEKLYSSLALMQDDNELSLYDQSEDLKIAGEKVDSIKSELIVNQTRYVDMSKSMSLDAKVLNPEKWDNESKLLGENELIEYKEKLKAKSDEAHDLLVNEVVIKMGNAIKEAKRSIQRYNNQIKDITFSGYKYEFKVEKKLSVEFGALYELFVSATKRALFSDGQGDIFTDDWFKDNAETIKQLEILLGLRNVNPQKNYQPDIDRYTDYRNYLDFDLIKYPEGEKETKSQSYKKSGKRGSGGEMQIDTYIPVVTAVYGACRNGLGFIMLDEAFSKVTGEYVKNALELLRQFKMEAILLAPTGRIEEFSEYSDKTFIVEKKNSGGRDFAFVCPYV